MPLATLSPATFSPYVATVTESQGPCPKQRKAPRFSKEHRGCRQTSPGS